MQGPGLAGRFFTIWAINLISEIAGCSLCMAGPDSRVQRLGSGVGGGEKSEFGIIIQE